jgi:hypothetical protein
MKQELEKENRKKRYSFMYFTFLKDFTTTILQAILYYSGMKILEVSTTIDTRLVFVVWVIWVIFRLVDYVVKSRNYFMVVE